MADQSREMVVAGEGKVTAEFDEIVIFCTILAEDKTSLQKVKAKHSEYVHQFLELLKGKGVSEKNIKTVHYHYGPTWEWDQSHQRQIKKGYQATQQFQVRDFLERGSDLLDMMPDYVSVNSTVFAASNSKELHEEAVDLAIANAFEKAKRRAERLDVVVGKVLHFEEGMVHVPRHRGINMLAMRADMADADVAPELPAGEAEIQAFVTIVYEIT